MQQIRSFLFTGLWTLWTSLFAPVLGGLMLARARPIWVRRWARLWASGVLGMLKYIVGLDHVVRGRENIPAKPCLIVCNHQSTWETIAVLILFPNVAITTKKELLKVPVFGPFLRLSPMITIDRESGSRAIRKMNEEGALALSQGRSVLIFPEGTRSEPGAPVEFKRGVELLYGKLNCELLPVAMNSGDFWRPGRQNKKAGTITLTCLPPIPAGENAAAAIKAAEAAIQAELTSIRATAA
jgi:1-acyl-sn-glycerol-3-phosphate acyltransferase